MAFLPFPWFWFLLGLILLFTSFLLSSQIGKAPAVGLICALRANRVGTDFIPTLKTCDQMGQPRRL
jgi:hypothetical protein